MAGFNGSTLTPINSNNKSEVRNTLDVYSKSEIDSTISQITAAPYVATITTGQWSGSGSDYYITVTASNVTANSILVPTYDHTSDSRLGGPVWCVPAAGSFNIHTSAIPTGTVTIMVQFIGTLGEAQYQVLADVYSKSQTDALIAQSTATVISGDTFENVTTLDDLQTKILTYISSSTILLGQHVVRVTGIIQDAPFNISSNRPFVMTLYKTSSTRLWVIIGSPNGGLFHGRYDGNWHWIDLGSTADSGWLNLDTGIDYRLHHDIVFVNLNKAVSLSTTYTVIGTLPSGYRPLKAVYFRCTGPNGAGGVSVYVSVNGNINARVDSGTGTAVNGHISFVCK